MKKSVRFRGMGRPLLCLYIAFLFFGALPDAVTPHVARGIRSSFAKVTQWTSILPGMELFRREKYFKVKVVSECFEAKTFDTPHHLTSFYRTDWVCDPPHVRFLTHYFEKSLVRMVQELQFWKDKSQLSEGLGYYFCKGGNISVIRYRRTKNILDLPMEVPPSNMLIVYDCLQNRVLQTKSDLLDTSKEIRAYEQNQILL